MNLAWNGLPDWTGNGWYHFLKDEYFRWKYTAKNRYTTTTNQLRRYIDEGTLDELHQVCQRLLSPPEDVHSAVEAARAIHGLGPSGASGLLALMHPGRFGTADQFVVLALQEIETPPEADRLKRMKPESLSTQDVATVIKILRQKAAENNDVFKSDSWTPRKVDMVLWAFRRRSGYR